MIQNIIVTILAVFFVALAIQFLIKLHKAVEHENKNQEFYQWQYEQYLDWKRKQEI